MFDFDAPAFKAEDIPDLSGKVILVTGGICLPLNLPLRDVLTK